VVPAVKTRRGRKPRTVDVRALTGMTLDQLEAMRSALDKTPESSPLVLKLRRLISHLMTFQGRPWDREFIRNLRFYYVMDGRQRGAAHGWDELDYAVAVLKGTQAEAGRDQMKKDFLLVLPQIPDGLLTSGRRPNKKLGVSFDHAVQRARAWAFHNVPGWPLPSDDAVITNDPHN